MLYKYYSAKSEYAIDNLFDGKISFTPLDALNDPYEGIATYSYEVDEEEQAYWDELGIDLPQMMSDKLSEKTKEVLNFKYRVFSATKEYDNPLLWAYYADSHKGFCVGYDESSISDMAMDLVEIDYGNELFQFSELEEETFIKLLSVKAKEWYQEKECRAIYQLKESDVSERDEALYYNTAKQLEEGIMCAHWRYRQTDPLVTLCAKRFIQKDCSPKEIYMGIKMETEDKKKLCEAAAKHGCKIYQMVQEKNSFQLNRMELPACGKDLFRML